MKKVTSKIAEPKKVKKGDAPIAPKKAAPKKATPKVAAPKVAVPEPFQPKLHEAYLWTGKAGEFIGEITSFDPLTVIKHRVVDYVHIDEPIDVASLADFDIRPMTQAEIYERLY